METPILNLRAQPTNEVHPALAVNDIKNAIPLTLDFENVQYTNWVKMFETMLVPTMFLITSIPKHLDPLRFRILFGHD